VLGESPPNSSPSRIGPSVMGWSNVKIWGNGQAKVLSLRPGPATPPFALDHCWAFDVVYLGLDCGLVCCAIVGGCFPPPPFSWDLWCLVGSCLLGRWDAYLPLVRVLVVYK
jgi:hypothetical protein